jgi:hypothetical protein
MKVRVYRNLNNGKMSIQCCASGHILGHCAEAYLLDVAFVVRESGRQRVLKERRKNVHAFATGTLIWATEFTGYRGRTIVGLREGAVLNSYDYEPVRYNPYEMSTFCSLDGEPIQQAQICLLSAQQGVLVVK